MSFQGTQVLNPLSAPTETSPSRNVLNNTEGSTNIVLGQSSEFQALLQISEQLNSKMDMFQTKRKSPPRNQAKQLPKRTFQEISTQTLQDKAGEAIVSLTYEKDKLQDLLQKA